MNHRTPDVSLLDHPTLWDLTVDYIKGPGGIYDIIRSTFPLPSPPSLPSGVEGVDSLDSLDFTSQDNLYLLDLFVVRYEDGGFHELKPHRDGGEVSFNLPLNDDYSNGFHVDGGGGDDDDVKTRGGGTLFVNKGTTEISGELGEGETWAVSGGQGGVVVRPRVGKVLLHSGKTLHGGWSVGGEGGGGRPRFVLVGFVGVKGGVGTKGLCKRLGREDVLEGMVGRLREIRDGDVVGGGRWVKGRVRKWDWKGMGKRMERRGRGRREREREAEREWEEKWIGMEGGTEGESDGEEMGLTEL